MTTKTFLIVLPKDFFFFLTGIELNPHTEVEQHGFSVPILIMTSLSPLYGCNFKAADEGDDFVTETGFHTAECGSIMT